MIMTIAPSTIPALSFLFAASWSILHHVVSFLFAICVLHQVFVSSSSQVWIASSLIVKYTSSLFFASWSILHQVFSLSFLLAIGILHQVFSLSFLLAIAFCIRFSPPLSLPTTPPMTFPRTLPVGCQLLCISFVCPLRSTHSLLQGPCTLTQTPHSSQQQVVNFPSPPPPFAFCIKFSPRSSVNGAA